MSETPLLLATEHTEFDGGAERVALALAARRGVPLHTVLPLLSNDEIESGAPQWVQAHEHDAAGALQALQQEATAAGVTWHGRVRRGGDPAREILDEASHLGAGLLVIRRRGRAGFLARLRVGEMVGRVLAHAPCDVLVAPRDAQPWSRGVMAFLEPGSAGAVLRAARAVAEADRLALTLVHAGADGSRLQRAIDRARDRGIAARVEALQGKPADSVPEALRRHGADLLVVSRPHGGLAALGAAVAHRLIGHCDVPVWVAGGVDDKQAGEDS